MESMRLLTANSGALKFSAHPQVYNWYYPQPDAARELLRCDDPFTNGPTRSIRRSALYLHIPFCDTICSFCPFVRAGYRAREEIESYVQALISEIKQKANSSLVGKRKFDAVFIGGGTPSVLEPEQIRQIGQALYDYFDLNSVKEFSVEFEAKTTDSDRIAAFRAIGANRCSTGVQTLSPLYREIFNLTASLDQVHLAVSLLKATFPIVNVDLLYGMNGQSIDEFINDLEAFIALRATTIDLYPINNLATQPKLHREFHHRNMLPLSGNAKFAFRQFGSELLQASGFKPHNGYSFTRVTGRESGEDQLLTRAVEFLYHDIVYGYEGDEFIGLGAGAISQTSEFKIGNIENRNAYIQAASSKARVDAAVYSLDRHPERGIVYFPYRGDLLSNAIDWDLVPSYTRTALTKAVDAGLITQVPTGFHVTYRGWLSYVHLMHFLCPPDQVELLDRRLQASAARRLDGNYVAVTAPLELASDQR